MRGVVAVLAAAVLLAGCGTADTAGTAKQAPARLPDTALRPLRGGTPVELRSLRGPMVVNLWASWCTPCRTELPLYQSFAKAYAGRVDVIGIDFQETRTDAALALAKKSGLSFPLLADPDGALRAVGLPKLVLLDAQGRIAHEEYVEITSVPQLERLVRTHLGVSR